MFAVLEIIGLLAAVLTIGKLILRLALFGVAAESVTVIVTLVSVAFAVEGSPEISPEELKSNPAGKPVAL